MFESLLLKEPSFPGDATRYNCCLQAILLDALLIAGQYYHNKLWFTAIIKRLHRDMQPILHSTIVVWNQNYAVLLWFRTHTMQYDRGLEPTLRSTIMV